VKLLLDQNLSRRLVAQLARAFAGTKHVVQVGLDGADDERIWRYAREHGYVIVSKDSDFMHRSTVRGHPPKVIQLRVGNGSTEEISAFLLGKKLEIRTFLKHKEESLLILH
jgi:predicted nuclease of predicted toxin-antitoxin system